MKQVFYKGLLALTIAFGVTSCDKNELPDAPSVGVIVNDEYSKVSFDELGSSIVVPKLKGATASAAKNAGQFDHIYASTSSQTLNIVNAAGESVYDGSYTANMISGINPASIILANANGYIATSSNDANSGLGVVAGFLPYTSRAEFNLSASTDIQLQATLERGFLIVNAEQEAADGNRVTGATANGTPLLRDADGDFYGYLLGGEHAIVVSYDLDGTTTPINATQMITLGTAYTINVMFANEPIDVVDSVVTTSTGTGLESEIGQTEGGRDINGDGDFLDALERVVTWTQATLNGDPQGDPVPAYGSWSVVSDVNLSSSSEESTELAETTDVNGDTDMHDVIARPLAITTTIVGDDSTVVSVPGAWAVIDGGDYSAAGFGETGTGTSNFVARDYSVWSPLTAAVDVENIDQSRTVLNADASASFDPAIAEVLTQTVSNSAYVADEADEYTSVSTPITTGGVTSTIDSGDPVVTFLYGGGSYDSEVEAQAAADADASAAGTTVTIVRSSSQGKSIETTAIVVTTTTVYSVQINVREDASPLPAKDDLVVPVTTPASSVAGVAVVSTSDLFHNVDAADNSDTAVDAWLNAAGDALDTSLADQGIITNAIYPTKGYELVITVDPSGLLNDIATIKFYVDGAITNELAGSATDYAVNHNYAQGEIANGNQ